ncbi:MAG: DUF3426 domain-containing protein [Alcaligenaceae bacterium]|nr:DUF3426 domain-containing protein [Alcaligenaceae bacterium]
MKTRCPECDTTLSVTPPQLKARGGKVRCGVCHTVFNALDYPVAHKSHDEYYSDGPEDLVLQDEPYLHDSHRYDEAYDRVVHDDYDDSYYVEQRGRRRSGGVFWVLTIFILLVALVLQGTLVFRNQIAHYFPSSWPMLIQFCSIANCELGGTRSIDQFSLRNVSLNVRSDVPPQDSQTALVLQARLVNQENKPAEWPSLLLSLKDARGQVDRQRIISPEEYIVSELRVQPMAALSEYPILLHLSLAGAMATGYELKPYYEE